MREVIEDRFEEALLDFASGNGWFRSFLVEVKYILRFCSSVQARVEASRVR